ncbi:MAG TPA: lycopene cyclase domain-containing protein [Jatrophihabitans sp.]|nr:lycopene cyclase domain-containing protein [Jatrophihabitans sp.]
MTYTLASLVAVAAALGLDLVVARTALVIRRAFWTAYSIVLAGQLVVNGVLTGIPVVRYDPDVIIGWRLVYAPVEDLLFGFAMVLATLSLWVWWGRRAAARAGSRARAARR